MYKEEITNAKHYFKMSLKFDLQSLFTMAVYMHCFC